MGGLVAQDLGDLSHTERLGGQADPIRIVPKRLFPIFRYREVLPTSSELGDVIGKALEDSYHLIVICSPRSAKLQWVNEEIKQFRRLGNSDQVLCLIVYGENLGRRVRHGKAHPKGT